MPYNTEDLKRKRAPYSPRACEACRKRKGKCNGRRPCLFCAKRSIECKYFDSPEEQSRQSQDVEADNHHGTIESLARMVTQLQHQVESLSAQVAALKQSANSGTSVQDNSNPLQAPNNAAAAADSVRTGSIDCSSCTLSRRTKKRYMGLTSPEYSFDVAQLNSGENPGSSSVIEDGDPFSPNEDPSDAEDVAPIQEDGVSRLVDQQVRSLNNSSLLGFHFSLSKDAAVRLAHVYHSVVGELYPIYGLDRILESLDKAYDVPPTSWLSSRSVTLEMELEMLIVNVILCIALYAESASQSTTLTTIFRSCQSLIHAALGRAAGSFYYYCGRGSLAGRMCGIAGRLAVELGLHDGALQSQFRQGQDEDDLSIIIHTILIQDRIYNTASGLPLSLQLTDFERFTNTTAQTSYLKSMLSLILVTHKYHEPISIVAKGGVYDDDSYEVLDFQVQQWRKKSLDNHDFIHPRYWTSVSSSTVPAWAVAIYLRGNAVRSILLRPFFHTPTLTTFNKTKIAPALDIIGDTLESLHLIDSYTNIYRRHLPLFQHFLASSCSLLSLVVSFVQHNHGSLSNDMPPQFNDGVTASFEKALRLSKAYNGASAKSCRLWKRISAMRRHLVSLGLRPPDDTPADVTKASGSAHQSSQNNGGTNVQDITWDLTQMQTQGIFTDAEMDAALAMDPSWLVCDSLNLDLDGFGVDGIINFGDFGNLSYP